MVYKECTDIDKLSFSEPEIRENYCISKPHQKVYCDIVDAKITNITKLKNGHVISFYLENDPRKQLNEIDNISVINLLTNNKIWFQNELSEDEIRNMFYKSYCEQTRTIKTIIRSNQNVKVHHNNKLIEFSEFLKNCTDPSYFKQNVINVKLQLLGIYIYKNQTLNKWTLNTINIYENTEDINTESREDIEEFWNSMVDDYQDLLDRRMENIRKEKENIKNIYNDILHTKDTKEWDKKICELKKLIQNIIFQ